MKRKAEGDLDLNPRKYANTSQARKIFSPVDKAPTFRAIHCGRVCRGGEYHIYSIDTLPDLVNKVIETSGEELVTIRYLMSTQHELLFAQEGAASQSIPAHYQMTGERKRTAAACITAGNLQLNKECQILEVSHKSGDFQPSFDSLQWFLGAAFANGMKFSPELTIQKFSGKSRDSAIKVNVADLQTELSGQFTEEVWNGFKQNNKNLGTRVHEYAAPTKVPNYSGQARKFSLDENFILPSESGSMSHNLRLFKPSSPLKSSSFGNIPAADQSPTKLAGIKPPSYEDPVPGRFERDNPELKEAVLRGKFLLTQNFAAKPESKQVEDHPAKTCKKKLF